MVNRRPNLVFARVGPGSLHGTWASGPREGRTWDLQLSTFTECVEFPEGDFPLSIDKGTKWDSIVRYFEADPSLFDRYEYVFFPDDDLILSADQVGKVFDLCSTHRLDIAQPGLTPESHCWHSLLLACPLFELRYINYIEPMCPCIRTSYLKVIIPFVKEYFTGWGIDNIWAMFMKEPAYRAAILDAVPVNHTRPFGVGSIYSAFKSMDVDPKAERLHILKTYDEAIVGMVVYGGITKQGRVLNGSVTRILNGLYLIATSRQSRNVPSSLRAGLGSLIRAATLARYKPSQIPMQLDVER